MYMHHQPSQPLAPGAFLGAEGGKAGHMALIDLLSGPGTHAFAPQLSEMQRLASGRSDGSSGLLKSSADSVLTGTSPPNGDSPLASFGTLNLDYPVLGSGADVQKSQSQLAATAEATSALCLRTSLVVGASTDIYQAAELLRLSLQQSGVSSFVLQAPLGPITAPGAQATLCAALRVAVAARQSHAASRASTDLAILPVLPSQAPEAAPDRVDLHVYEVTATLPATLQGQLAQVRVDLNSNPWLLVMQLTQVVMGGAQGNSPVRACELVFGPALARVALQVLASAQQQFSAGGHEVVLLPSHGDGASSAQFSVTVLPTALTNSHQMQAMAQAVQQLLAATSGTSCGGVSPTHQDTSLLQSELGRMNSAGHAASHPGWCSPAAPYLSNPLHHALSMPPSLGPLSARGVLDAAAEAGAAAAVAAVAATNAVAQQKAALSAAQQLEQQQQLAGPGSGGRGRARKADWVIVTEETAIKNAAGAIAKVLGRMAQQGLCCPVFMERKTQHYTGVVSVAVKAIAVARGYVHNEGSGHEVGFQPYVRGDASACAYGATRPPGAPASGSSDFSPRPDPLTAQLLQLAAADLSPAELLRLAGGSSPLGMSPRSSASVALGGCSPPMRGGSPLLSGRRDSGDVMQGGSGGSSICGEEDVTGVSWADMEQAELAFDVYKVKLQQELPEGNNLPVKVTAHSRPGVVSNIIHKLVTEKASAVLITAGGRAMHVAMLAVVSARQRLQSQGLDILLMPRFVTVDTTQTLGWESVFIKFAIIRWNPALALAQSEASRLDSAVQRLAL